MVLIWAIGVFGFQFLLIVLNKPTPEKNKATFDSVWTGVADGSATVEEKQAFARVTLDVLGKNIALKAPHKEALQGALSITFFNLLAEADRESVVSAITSKGESGLVDKAACDKVAAVIGLSGSGFDKLRADLLPSSLVVPAGDKLTADQVKAMPGIMQLYLVHNQNFFTDLKFLGFPFHYWYTAQFLLIMFVLLCLIYAVFIDKINKKYNFADE
jgi:putative solute:sodium symporter small subunit